MRKKNTNGYNVVSTFSGAGGSCIGLKLAGFNIKYAVEFIPEAQKTYALNHKDTYLDKRDIRNIKGKEILKTINLDKGELDLFEGSPPCSTFSRMGKGTEGWNCIKNYSSTKQRCDDLFFEFIRLVDEVKPKMILAENVPALAHGKNKGMLKLIIDSFKDIGYSIRMKILDSNFLDVPQSRQRLIFIGKRNDLDIDIEFPKPKNYRYVVKDAIPNFKKHKPNECYMTLEGTKKLQKRFDYCRKHHLSNFADASKILENQNSGFAYRVVYEELPSPTIIQKTESYHGYQNRSLSVDEAKILHTFPIDFKLTGSFKNQWERIGRSVPPKLYEAVGFCIKKSLDNYVE